ncbi:MAG: N-acetyl-gamma-glutamyl-phosphate reductase [Pseudomonadota bacterium]
MTLVPTVVIGATGYVGAEMLRLVMQHPNFALAHAVSRNAEQPTIGATFPHLEPIFEDRPFTRFEEAVEFVAAATGPVAVFAAGPHGQSAALLAEIAGAGNEHLHVVDVSADFRFADRDRYERIYGVEHGAPDWLAKFTSAPPELLGEANTPHVGHPGCFATAMLLAAAPLVAAELADGELFLTGITGSTGSGKSPIATTHHPERNANLYAYKPLAHRHAPEVESVLAHCTGSEVRVRFVPHSGPFARGIVVNLQARLNALIATGELRERYAAYYGNAPFVRLSDTGARLGSVVGSNYAVISVASDGATVAVSCAIDNLIKGAAGGAIQWMNRLHGFDEATGLVTPAMAWT